MDQTWVQASMTNLSWEVGVAVMLERRSSLDSAVTFIFSIAAVRDLSFSAHLQELPYSGNDSDSDPI